MRQYIKIFECELQKTAEMTRVLQGTIEVLNCVNGSFHLRQKHSHVAWIK